MPEKKEDEIIDSRANREYSDKAAYLNDVKQRQAEREFRSSAPPQTWVVRQQSSSSAGSAPESFLERAANS